LKAETAIDIARDVLCKQRNAETLDRMFDFLKAADLEIKRDILV
jgi:hypothetical protein